MSKRRRQSESDTTTDTVEEERYFLNPDSVSKHLFCSICQDVFTEPQRAPCGHSYCKVCIHQWIKNSNTCPEDRKHLRKSDLHHDFILENIIGDQMVACPFRGRGCEHIGQLQQLKSHKKHCSFNPDNLPDFLKNEAVSLNTSPASTSGTSVQNTFEDSEDETIPTLAKPSLKMRLFTAGGGCRDLLCSMFENSAEEKLPSSSPSKKGKKGKKSK